MKLNKLVFAVDCSGSLFNMVESVHHLRQLQSLLDEVQRSNPQYSVKVLLFDNFLLGQYDLATNLYDLKLEEVNGGGGTSAQVVIDFCKENSIDKAYIVTDGYFPSLTIDNIDVTCYIVRNGCKVENVTNIMVNMEA
jgi:predicted metal-dependent peptidase